MEVEEAERYQDEKKTLPKPIKVKFSNMKDRNLVLQAGRKYKGRVKILEEFTERDRISRKSLAEFAQEKSKKLKWVEMLKYFN